MYFEVSYTSPTRCFMFSVLQYAYYVAGNGFIALEWTRPSACQMAIPGDRPFELCARARLRVCIQSPREIYIMWPPALPVQLIQMIPWIFTSRRFESFSRPILSVMALVILIMRIDNFSTDITITLHLAVHTGCTAGLWGGPRG